jgi:RimJ/RimL family protein N-acetyltransferase
MNNVNKTGGDKFWLRPLSRDHIPLIAKWTERVDDLTLFDRRTPLPLNREAVESAWESSIVGSDPKTSYWYIIVDSEGEAVGTVGLQDINYVHGDAVCAILVSESDRRNGLGIRAGALLLDMAFRQLRLSRITSYVRADNDASRCMTKRLGFSEEGCIRQGWFADGKHTDIILIGQLREEWSKSREKLRDELDASVCITLGNGSSEQWSWPGP